MNAAVTISLGSALVAIFTGVLSRRVAVAPGSGEQRWFSVVVLASAGYALANLSTMVPAAPGIVFVLCGVEVALLAVLVWGWIRFSQEFVGVAPGRLERVVARSLLALAPVLAFPGLLFSDRVTDRPFAPLGVVYRQADATPLGSVAFVLLVLVASAVLVRLVGAARRGVRHATPLAVAYAMMLACAISDAFTTALALPLPFLLDWGFAPTAVAVAWMNTCRLVDATRALERLRGELESQVDTRTAELSSAMERLHQAEKLAALGRFANGVAHEVNNPAAVVNASLGFLLSSPAGRLGRDELEALDDAREGMKKITCLVRRLVDAGRLASPPGLAVAEVTAAIAHVVRLQPEAVRARVAVDAGGAAGAFVRLREDALQGTVETLVRNAADATLRGGPGAIEIRAERVAGRVRITVTDRGEGMPPEVLGRAFDPFFTTKPEGHGAGLGLAVARGIVLASGGDLTLESAPGAGTRATLELPEARRPADRAETPAPLRAAV